MITASLASIPDRIELLKQTVESIIPQVSRINIILNNYPEIPGFLNNLPCESRIVLSDNFKGCGEKFRWADEVEEFHLILDDDIIYPADYVLRMVAASQAAGDKAVIGVHGVWFNQLPISDYRTGRTVAHFQRALMETAPCHLLGTGTLLYHRNAIRFTYCDIRSANLSDIWFAIAAQRAKVPLLCIAREAGWLRYNPLMIELNLPTIYSNTLKDGSRAVELINSREWNLYQSIAHNSPKENDALSESNKSIATSDYWEKRYAGGGNSGAGSRGRLGHFKAETLNAFVREHSISNVIEFGCGDGEQLSLCRYPRYLGFDVSPSAVSLCRSRFADDPTKQFELLNSFSDHRAPLCLSLDVVYHLNDVNVYESHLRNLFEASERYVIIYSSNFEQSGPTLPPHIRHRAFTKWIEEHVAGWVLRKIIDNRYPFTSNHEEESFSNFFFYERVG